MNNRVGARRWFSTVAPPEGLVWAVACSWSAVPDGMHRLTPDGCADVVCLSDGTMMLCGPERRSWNFQLANGITAVGVRMRPGMANLVFEIDVSTPREFLDEYFPTFPDLADPYKTRTPLVAILG